MLSCRLSTLNKRLARHSANCLVARAICTIHAPDYTCCFYVVYVGSPKRAIFEVLSRIALDVRRHYSKAFMAFRQS